MSYAHCDNRVVSSVCKPTAITAIIVSAGADCRYLRKIISLSADSNFWRVTSVVLPRRHKWRQRHSLGDGYAVRAPEGV